MSIRSLSAALATCLCTAALAQPALPQRQSGLWETSVDGRHTGMGLCVARERDDVLTSILASEPAKAVCSRSAPRREAADRLVVENVCVNGGKKKIVRVVFSGDAERQLTAELSTSFDPPRQGRAAPPQRFEMRWTGACPAGAKPGQLLVMPAR